MAVVSHGRIGPFDWAVAQQALPGEHQSGDGWVVANADDSILFGAIDGLGHGASAALPARRAAEVLREHCADPLDTLFTICHEALSGTRGAAITLARVNHADASMSWLGVGNVVASLVRSAPGDPALAANAILRAGVVGHQLPATVYTDPISLRPGDLLLFGTDGLTSGFDVRPDLAAPAATLAQDILTRCATGIDDALILVARYRGAAR